jgi:hypothetical protein
MKDTTNSIAAFLKGFASVFDLSGKTFIDVSDFSGGFARDKKALQGDWVKVGADIRNAMNQVVCER